MPHPFATVVSHALVLPKDDVDTDQIIPARFLTTTERLGLGRHLFADWRSDGNDADVGTFVLNQRGAHSAKILIAGRNFGCGSSREHAAWALKDFGFQVIVARSFADIFRSNALKNSLLPVALPDAAHEALLQVVGNDPSIPLTVDLSVSQLSLPDGTAWDFTVPAFSRRCLLEGVDQLGFLLAADVEISAFERSHPSNVTTVA
ncbi:MAG: 3-isopropylmalate dehydratase small subunit [Gemmatimonadaceae bacterium]